MLAIEATQYDYDNVVKTFNLDKKYNQHTFYECQICGNWRWHSSSVGDKEKILTMPYDGYANTCCLMCYEAFCSHPEIAEWVVSMFDFHLPERNKDGENGI